MAIPIRLKIFISANSITVRSPGRINLIGEHTDYNDGFVLPAAIDKAAWLVLTLRNDNQIHLHSLDFNEVYITGVDDLIKSTASSWPNYLLGVVQQFKSAGINIAGFDAALASDIPVGAGLSSSAAVECAMAMALNLFTNAGFDKLTLVKMAQKAEHDFAGVQCGIMDQFASMFGKKNQVIKLDCRSLEYEYLSLNIEGYKIVLFDTNIKHSLASSEYNVRRKQCEAGVASIQQQYPAIKNLRDVTIEMLNQFLLPVDKLIYNRCKYVVEENNRLLKACTDLKNGDLKSFGKKMFETHEGLSKLYEVSCNELDFLVNLMQDNLAVIGARMMGGGFGGCTINLVKEDAISTLVNQTEEAYKAAFNLQLKTYIANIEDGTSVINHNNKK